MIILWIKFFLLGLFHCISTSKVQFKPILTVESIENCQKNSEVKWNFTQKYLGKGEMIYDGEMDFNETYKSLTMWVTYHSCLSKSKQDCEKVTNFPIDWCEYLENKSSGLKSSAIIEPKLRCPLNGHFTFTNLSVNEESFDTILKMAEFKSNYSRLRFDLINNLLNSTIFCMEICGTSHQIRND